MNNSERLFSRNKRDSKSTANNNLENLRKSNNSTKPIASPAGESKSKTKDFKRENIIFKNVTSESDKTGKQYDNNKKFNELKNDTETKSNGQLLNKAFANETLFRRNIRDSKNTVYQNTTDSNGSTIHNLGNLKITNTKEENSTNIVSRKMALYVQRNSSSFPSSKRQNFSMNTEVNGNVDLSKLEDLTQILNMFNEPTVKQDNINEMLSALDKQYALGNVNENSEDPNNSLRSPKLVTGTGLDNFFHKDIIEGNSIDKLHDLLSEATKLDPLKYHAQLLEDLIESVVPSDVSNKDSSRHILFGMKDKKVDGANMDLPYLSKAEKKAFQNEDSLSPKDRLLITLLARESKWSRDSETIKSDSGLVSTSENGTTGNELVNLLRKLTNALETKSKSMSYMNVNDKNQEITNVKKILKEFEVENKHSVYGNVKKILCELIDDCDVNHLKFGIPRDRMIDEDNIEELKRHLLRLLADLERIGGTSKKYEFYNRSKVDDVLSDLLKSVDNEKIKEETDYQQKNTRTLIENETAINIKELRHSHALHHRDKKTKENIGDISKATKILAKMLKSLNLLRTETSFSSRRKETQDYLPGDTPYDVSKSVMLWERIMHNLNEDSDSKKQAKTRKMNTLPKSYNQNDITSIINNLENDDLILRKSGNSDISNDPTFKLSILKAQELEMSKYIKTLRDIRDVMDNIELAPKFLKKIENFLVDVQYDLDLNKNVIDTVVRTSTLKNVKAPDPDISMFNAFNQFLLNDRSIHNKMQKTTATQESQSIPKTNPEDTHSLRAILQKYNIRRHMGGFVTPPKVENPLIFKKEHIYNQIAKNSLNKLSFNNNEMNPNTYSMVYDNYIQDSSYVPQLSTNIDTRPKLHPLDNIEGIIASMCRKIPCRSGRRFMTRLDTGHPLYVPQVRIKVRGQSPTASGMESMIESICSKIPCQPENSIDVQDTFPRPIAFNRQGLNIPSGIQEAPRLLFALEDNDGHTRIQQNRADRISRYHLEDFLRGISHPKIQ